MNDLPPEITQLATFLDAQPVHIQSIFQYCLCLMMVEAGKVRLVETVPGESGAICTFETVAGDIFSLPKPTLSQEQEAALINRLRVILDEEGGPAGE